MNIKFVILPCLAITTLLLGGCGNTAEGVGRDMEEWGKTIQETF